MKPIRVGIIGVGLIGKTHLDNYSKIPGVEVVAAADIHEGELRRVADKYQIASVYTDFRELIARDDIDAVDVCLHNNLHAPVTIAALRAGKHVYCEKPIAGSYADGKAMVDAAAECDRLLHIQLGTLYTAETRVAKVLIEEGKLGKIYHARSTGYRRRGRPYVDGYGTEYFTRKHSASGGALFDMGVYHLAQLLYLLGPLEVTRVSGKIYQELDMDHARRTTSGFDVEELAVGFVHFQNGLTLDVIESWAIQLNAFEGSSIAGSQGGIRLPGVANGKPTPLSYHSTICDVDMDSTFDVHGADYRWHQLRENSDAYDSSQEHWVAAIQDRVSLLPTAQLALQTMLISEGIYLSDERNQEVTSEEVIATSKSYSVSL